MPTKVDLTYHVPSIGNARVTLCDESAELYRFLAVTGEVERLKKLDHLGLLRAVWDGAHHPRWEYAISILNLIEHCKHQVPEVHFGGPVRLSRTGVTVSSGEELLRSWVLLLNVGHVHWTFACERALLLELRPGTRFRRDFLGLLGDPSIRPWAEGILGQTRVYQFFQTLSFARLTHLAAAHSNAALPTWREMLGLYVDDAGASPRILSLRRVYRNLRRIAYLALDTHYTPAAINVNLARVLADPRALASIALRGADEHDELQALESQLTREMYLSERAISAVAARERSLRTWIRGSLEKVGVETTLDHLANGDFVDAVDAEPLNTVVRLPAWVVPPLDRFLVRDINIRTEQRASDRDLSVRDPGSRAIWWAAPEGRQWILQTFAPDVLASQQASFDFAFNEVARIHGQASGLSAGVFRERDLQGALFGQLGASLVEAALRIVFARNARWEWDVVPGTVEAWFTTRQHAIALIEASRKRVDSDRADELTATAAALPGGPNTYLALNASRLTAYEAGGSTQIGELDGIVVASDNVGVLSITIVEAKRQRSGGMGAARNQQNNLISRLRLRPGIIRDADTDVQAGRFVYATTTLSARAWAPLPKP